MMRLRKKTLSSSSIPWLERHGIEDELSHCGSGHIKITLFYAGQSRSKFEAFSTSDGARTRKNNVAQTKRMLREMGWNEQ